MKIPEVHALIEIEHNGKVIKTVVDDVQPDPESPRFWWVTLILPAGSGIARNDQCYWVTPEGRAPAAVHQIATAGVTKIVLRAIED